MSICSNCHIGEMEHEDGKKYQICPDCGCIEMLYKPQPYQHMFHEDPTRFKFLAGGYG